MNEQEILAKYDKTKTFTERFTGGQSLTLDEVLPQLVEFVMDLHTMDDEARQAFSKKYLHHDLQIREQEIFTLYSRLLDANKRAAQYQLKTITLQGFLLCWDSGHAHGTDEKDNLLELGEIVQYNGLYDFIMDILVLPEADQRHVAALLAPRAQKFCNPVFQMVRQMKDLGQLNNLPQFFI